MNFNTLRKGVFLFFAFGPMLAQAQRSPVLTTPDRLYMKGVEQMDDRLYEAAAVSFEEYARLRPGALRAQEAEFLALLAHVRAGEDGAGNRLEGWAEANPQSPYANRANLALALDAWGNKKWERSVRYFDRTSRESLSPAESAEADFKHGYALLSLKEFDKAQNYFERVKRGNTEYAAGASYYSAYLAMRGGRYDTALEDLQRAERDKTYKPMVPLLRANLYYRQRQYDKVIAKARIGGADSSRAVATPGLDDLNLLTGEAYFQKKDYKTAARYFNQYSAKNKGKLPRDLSFRVGYSHYLSGAYDKAVPPLLEAARTVDTAAGKRDTVGQQASYYLGLSYLKQKNIQFALNSFIQARQVRGDSATGGAAWLASSKALFDLKRYDAALQAAEEFKRRYPNHAQESDADEIIGESYLNTSNYEAALAYIQRIKNKTPQVLRAFQRALLNKGIDLFNSDSTDKAAQFLEKSIQYPQDKELVPVAHHWAGESYSAEGDWVKAQGHYAAVFQHPGIDKNPIYLPARYGIGYAYFNQQQYDKALPHFREYCQVMDRAENKQFYATAILRLADCYYAAKQYPLAVATYDRAIQQKNPETDYALYQKALALQGQNNDEGAAQALDQLLKSYPGSRYRDEGTFQRAQIALDQGNFQAAIEGFSTAIRTNPGGTVAPFAYLKRATAHVNLKEFDKASADYKKVLDSYPQSPAAQTAIVGLQESLNGEGKTDDFYPYLEKYKQANPGAGSTEQLEFEAAKGLYFNQRYAKAITALEAYVKSYPASNLATEAYFYAGESYYRTNDRLKAIENHEQVVKAGPGNFLTRSLSRLGDMEHTGGNYAKSNQYFRQLQAFSRNRKEQVLAMVGLMENYFDENKLDSASALAAQIQEVPNATLEAQNRASLFIGKIAYQKGEYEKAQNELLTCANSAKDVNGAEAQYLLAEILHKKKEYRESLNTLYDLNRNFPQYQRWKDRAFLLIADNFIALGDNYQATATLNSIIAESPDKKTKDAAKAKLDALGEDAKAKAPTTEEG